MDEWLTVACRQKDRFAIPSLVITCGKDGILVFTPDGIYQAGCAEVKEVNAAGAGDAVSAALVYRFSLGELWTSSAALGGGNQRRRRVNRRHSRVQYG